MNDVTISGVGPNEGPAEGGTNIIITGSNFSQNTVLKSKNVVSGENHSCSLAQDNQIYCWGMKGFLGDGQEFLGLNDPNLIQTTLVKVINPDAVNSWKQITAGAAVTCAIGDNDQAYCWGAKGYLGDGQAKDSDSVQVIPSEVIRPTGVNFWKTISTGYEHSCAIADNNQSYCWGRNNIGQLGNGANDDQLTPTQIYNPSGVSSWKSISAGSIHSCAIADNDQLYCWGHRILIGGGFVQNNKNIPNLAINPIGVESWRYVSAGGMHSCAISNENLLYCWGYNFHEESSCVTGSLGIGVEPMYIAALIPQRIYDKTNKKWKTVSLGDSHTCAIDESNQAFCWGEGSAGQLGDNFSTAKLSDLVDVCVYNKLELTPVFNSLKLGPWQQISAGSSHTCGVASDGQTVCWGYNMYGQLGNGKSVFDDLNNISSPTPSYVMAENGIPNISLGATDQNGIATPINLEYISDTELRATTTAHAPGLVNLTVTNPTGEFIILSDGFRYLGNGNSNNNSNNSNSSDIPNNSNNNPITNIIDNVLLANTGFRKSKSLVGLLGGLFILAGLIIIKKKL